MLILQLKNSLPKTEIPPLFKSESSHMKVPLIFLVSYHDFLFFLLPIVG